MTVRKATTSDLDQLADLFDQYRVFYHQVSNPAAARAFLSDRLHGNEAEIFVCEVDSRLVGFVQLYPVFSSVKLMRLWLLNDLFVTPAFRGRGISLLLMDRAKTLAKKSNAAGLFLETAKSNVVGNTLYPKAGFVVDAEHNYYFWPAD